MQLSPAPPSHTAAPQASLKPRRVKPWPFLVASQEGAGSALVVSAWRVIERTRELWSLEAKGVDRGRN